MSTPSHDPAIIAEELILLDADLGESTESVIERLSEVLAGAGRATDAAPLRDAALARDPKALTIDLPAGKLVARKQQPEWIYDDEAAFRSPRPSSRGPAPGSSCA